MYCPNCGANLADNAGQCPVCGAVFAVPAAQPVMAGAYIMPPKQKLSGTMMYNKTVHILSAVAFGLSSIILFAVSAFSGLISLFKHDVLFVTLMMLLLVVLNIVAAVKNVLVSSPNVRWSKADSPDRRGKHDCIASCLSAVVFIIEMILLMSSIGSDPSGSDKNTIELVTALGIGLALNIIAAIIAVKDIKDTDIR